jgi:plastocyanin
MQAINPALRRASVFAALALLGACGGGSSSTGTPTGTGNPGGTTVVATTSVAMVNSAFVPPAISVSPGAVVTFTNNDNNTAHNVTFTSTAIGATPDYNSGARTLTMPTATGTYPYRCTLHAGMSGTVTVQ